jgi:copper(I)-binding protein
MAKLLLFFLFIFTTALADAPLRVEDAYIAAAPPTAPVMAAYMTLHNDGSDEITLSALSSPQFDRVEMHLTEVVDGVARMVPQSSLKVLGGSSIALEPGSYHLMLMGPKATITPARPVELVVETSAGTLSINLPVKRNADH